MAKLAGNLHRIWIKATEAITDGTGAEVAGVSNSAYNQMADMLDASEVDNPYKERVAGLKDTNFSVTMYFDPADTNGQLVIIPGNTVYVGLYRQGTTVADIQVPCLVESANWTGAVDGMQEYAVSFQGAGAPVALPAQS